MSDDDAAVITNVGLALAEGVPVVLRGSTGGRLHLALGDEVAIVLERSHLRALTGQAAAALRDTAAVEAAENVVADAWEAGSQARTAAEAAREPAEAARRAGAVAEADRAVDAARHALAAANEAQAAVRTAFHLIDVAEQATEEVRTATGAAARAAARA